MREVPMYSNEGRDGRDETGGQHEGEGWRDRDRRENPRESVARRAPTPKLEVDKGLGGAFFSGV